MGKYLLALAAAALGLASPTLAASLTTLADFTGFVPRGDLIVDNAGRLVGTTRGEVFRYDLTSASLTTLVSLPSDGSKGASARAGVITDPLGNLYGVTLSGGAGGNGVVFKIDSADNFSVLADLSNSQFRPRGGLYLGPGGQLYGTTAGGGGGDWAACTRSIPRPVW